MLIHLQKKWQQSFKNFQSQRFSPVYLGNEDTGKCSSRVKFSRPLKSKIKDTLNHTEVLAPLLSKMEQNRNHKNQGAFTFLIILLNLFPLLP